MKGMTTFFGMVILAVQLYGQASVTASRNALRIGEQIDVTIEVNVPEGHAWDNREAVWPDSMDAFAVVGQPAYANKGNPYRDTYTLAVFDTGEVIMPPLPILISGPEGTDTFMTAPVHLAVASVEPDAGGLIPIRDIHREPFRPAYYARYIPHVLALLLLVAALVYVAGKRRKRVVGPAPVTPVISPEGWAEGQLDELMAARLWQRGDIKGHYTRLTDIFREYLERRFRIRALEQTTPEIRVQLKDIRLRPETIQDVADLLQVADYVKFAKADPGVDMHAHAIERVRAFIRDVGAQEPVTNDPHHA